MIGEKIISKRTWSQAWLRSCLPACAASQSWPLRNGEEGHIGFPFGHRSQLSIPTPGWINVQEVVKSTSESSVASKPDLVQALGGHLAAKSKTTAASTWNHFPSTKSCNRVLVHTYWADSRPDSLRWCKQVCFSVVVTIHATLGRSLVIELTRHRGSIVIERHKSSNSLGKFHSENRDGHTFSDLRDASLEARGKGLAEPIYGHDFSTGEPRHDLCPWMMWHDNIFYLYPLALTAVSGFCFPETWSDLTSWHWPSRLLPHRCLLHNWEVWSAAPFACSSYMKSSNHYRAFLSCSIYIFFFLLYISHSMSLAKRWLAIIDVTVSVLGSDGIWQISSLTTKMAEEKTTSFYRPSLRDRICLFINNVSQDAGQTHGIDYKYCRWCWSVPQGYQYATGPPMIRALRSQAAVACTARKHFTTS